MEKLEVKCHYCGYKFTPRSIPALSANDHLVECPNCGLNTPIPFQVAMKLGGKIPGEE